MILAGDVGGTKTRLAIYSENGKELVRGETKRYESAKFPGLKEIVKEFFASVGNLRVTQACFGVPGPVSEGIAKTTNLPWTLSELELSKALDIPKVKLINDLAAVASAIPYFSEDELLTLHPGTKDRDKSFFAVLAPGTGLGAAFLFHDGVKYHPLPSEGGHQDFAPNSEMEMELLRYLWKTYPHVSLERVLCGSGLLNIYNFLKDTGYAPEPPELKKRFSEEAAPAVISNAGLKGEFELCTRALDIFASCLGAEAGNLVLTLMCTGGVYLGGGIPPKITPKLSEGVTVKSYLEKGRLSNVVQKTPLYVIKDDHAALLGSAYLARDL